MRKALGAWCFVCLFSILYASSASAVVQKNEDTAHLTFKKTAISEEKLDTYTVKKGEWIFDIIRKKFDASEKEIVALMKEVRRLNPDIKNLHNISPGQKLLLPHREAAPVEEVGIGEDVQPKNTAALQTPDATHGEKSAESVQYTVKEGDSLSAIIHDELDVSYETIYQMMRTVKRLNPNIENINKIYPGQQLLLPFGKKEVAVPVVRASLKKKTREEKQKPPEPEVIKKEKKVEPHQQLATMGYVLSRINGTVITKGNYYIPLVPTGQVTIDCQVVPVVEYENGVTVIIDYAKRIPENLEEVIEATWNNYVVVRYDRKDALPAVLEKVINASRDYSFKIFEQYRTVGAHPPVRIYVDWVIAERASSEKTHFSFGIKRVRTRDELLPASIREYTDSEGFEVVELLDDTSPVGLTEPSPKMEVPALKSSSPRDLAASILSLIGYDVLRDHEVQVYSMKDHGFELSLKVDLYLKTEKTEVIIHSKRIPEQFTAVLTNKGIQVLYISETEAGKNVLKKVLNAIDAPLLADTFKFEFSKHGGAKGGEILLPAFRTKGIHGPVYFINQTFNPVIHGLLQQKWGVKVVQF